MASIKILANSYLIMALILGSLLPVMLDFAKNVNISGFLFLAYAISIPVSLLLVFATKRQDKLISYLSNWKEFALIAVIGILNFATLEYGLTYAERFISASLATVVYRSYPLLMLLFIPFVLKEKVTKYQFAALLLAFAGLYIAFTGGSVSAFSGSNPGIILFLILIALVNAFAVLLVKRFTFNMASAMFIFSVANTAFFGIAFALSGAALPALTGTTLVSLLYVAIAYNVLTGFMYYEALRMQKTTFVTNVYFLSPFLTILFASLILGESVQLYYLIIAALVSVGIVIQKFDKKGGAYVNSKTASNRFWIFDVTGAFENSRNPHIDASIKNGGRVFASKLNSSYADGVNDMLKDAQYTGVFVGDGIPNREHEFVRGVLEANDDEMVLLKVGNAEDGERFFSDLSTTLNIPEETDSDALPK